MLDLGDIVLVALFGFAELLLEHLDFLFTLDLLLTHTVLELFLGTGVSSRSTLTLICNALLELLFLLLVALLQL